MEDSRTPARTHLLLAALLLFLCFAALAAATRASASFHSDEDGSAAPLLERLANEDQRFVDLESFADLYYDLIDDDCDEAVSMKAFMKLTRMDGSYPQQLEILAAFDPNGDGVVQRNEIASGIEASVESVSDRLTAMDSDGDGFVTEQEIVLTMPNEDGKQAELSPEMRTFFLGMDQDGDEVLSMAEMMDFLNNMQLGSYWSYNVSQRLAALDADSDGVLHQKELAAGLKSRGVSAPEGLDEWFEPLFESAPMGGMAPSKPEGSEMSIALDQLQMRLGSAGMESREWRLRVERPIRPLLIPACTATEE